MEPILTIIITTYNLFENEQDQSFQLLVSLLKLQTLKNIELLIIDNNSTDGTIDLLNKYKTEGVLDFYSEKDGGKFDGYNRGIKKAKGKYISFLTADDFYHDIMGLEAVINAMEKDNVEYSYSPTYCRHTQGFTFLYVPSIHNVFQVMPGPRQCMIFRKTLLEELNGFDTDFKYMSDYDLMIRIIMKNKYRGFYINRNFTTYKLGKTIAENEMASRQDAKNIFIKNYNGLYEFNDNLLEKMVNTSDFPKELLEKLSTKFPESDRELFFERCEQMHKIRLNSLKQNQ